MNLKPVKKLLRRFVPAPIGFVDKKSAVLNAKLSEVLAATARLSEANDRTNRRIESIAAETARLIGQTEARLVGRSQIDQAEMARRIDDAEHRIVNELEQASVLRSSKALAETEQLFAESQRLTEGLCAKHQKQADELFAESQGLAEESVWAQIFNNTIVGSSWLRDVPLSPGRWAVGYPYLYVLYRALDETNPDSILDLGLGQSTKMIASYVAANPSAHHTVVEHDLNWIDFFKQRNSLSKGTELVHLPLIETAFLDDDAVSAYGGFETRLAGMKFGLISIDGPFGYKAKRYSRADIVKLLPDCLADSFVIMTDDFDRPGERATVDVIKRVLNENSIPFRSGVYSGKKQLSILTSEDLGFLCSM